MKKYFVRFSYKNQIDLRKNKETASFIFSIDHCSKNTIETIEDLENYLFDEYFQAHQSIYKDYELEILAFNIIL